MRRLLLLTVLLTLAALIAPGGAASAVAWRACPARVGVAPGASVRCTTVEVPLDRSDPASATVPLLVSLVVKGPLVPDHVVLTLAGGPGQGGIWTATSAVARRKIPAGWAAVGIDQRGAGVSALRCPGLQVQLLSDLALPLPGTVEACGDLLGAARAHYRTADTLDDLEAVRTALGIARWAGVWGVSYGSYVASRYARSYPAAVRAVVLQAVVPARTNVDPLQVPNMAAVRDVIRTMCASGGCRAGDVARDTRALAGRLAVTAPRTVALPGWGRRGRVVIDDVALLDAWESGSVTGDISDLPAATRKALQGDYLPLARTVLRTRYAPPVAEYSWANHFATLCADLPAPWGGTDVPVPDRAAAVASAVAALPDGATGLFGRRTAGRQGTVEGCRRWPAIATAPQDVPAAPAGTAALIVQGDLDLSTPAGDAAEEQADWPVVQRLRVRNGGHSWLADGCKPLTRGFLADLRLPRSSCGFGPIGIRLAYPGTVAATSPMRGRVRGKAARVLHALELSIWEAIESDWRDETAGLRGGSVTRQGARLRLRGYRFVRDLRLDGRIERTFDVELQHGTVRFAGAATGLARLRGRVWRVTIDGRSGYTIRYGSSLRRGASAGRPGPPPQPEGIAAGA